jgi:trimeric autotransporter adhesin
VAGHYLNTRGPRAPPNTLHIGLANRLGGQTVTFDFSCSATLDGAPYTLGGLVFADAETSGVPENISITIPAAGTFRMLERFRLGCTAPYEIIVDATGTVYTTNSPGNFCTGGSGPIGVGFIDGATSGSVQITGGGRTAIALGVMVHGTDYGDAPESYGEVGHLLQSQFTGGTIAAGTAQDVFAADFALAELEMPPLRLGELVDAEVRRIVDEELDATRELVSENRERLDRLVDALLEHETLDEVDAYAAAGIDRAAAPVS